MWSSITPHSLTMDALKAVYRYVSWPFARIAENTKGMEVPVRAAGSGYGRLAGILGATAIAALAYCAHGKTFLS